MTRDAILDHVAQAVLATDRPHPVRVGIDGIDAAGKTMFADELAARVAEERPVVRATIDGFHHPRAHRRRRGDGPLEYYEDSHDHGAMLRLLLAPLGPGGDRRYRLACFDFRSDQAVESPWREAPGRAVVIVDGVFLQRPELAPHWDRTVFLCTSFATSLARAKVRDADLFADGRKTEARYATRYVPGQKLYLARVRPDDAADILVDNDDWRAPRLLRGFERAS